MCIEAIVSNALGLEHSDKPYICVLPELADAKIKLNDCNWSSNKARAEGMVALGIAQLGSNLLERDAFLGHLQLLSAKRILPYLIQKHFENIKDEKLLEYKTKFENLTELDNALWEEFYNYNHNYYYYYHCNHPNYYYYYYYSFGDEFLLLIADVILQVLKNLNCEGCKYLHLLEK